jgi:hemin uptake protein HemP
LTIGREDRKEAPSCPPLLAGQPPRIKVRELMGGEREAILEHDGQDYRLRITASSKLILTK